MRDDIKKIIYIAVSIWTVLVLFIIYKKVDFPFVYEFVISYVICLLLVGLYSIISIFLNMRKLNWHTTRKILIRFIIVFFAFWTCNILFTYFTKGELILVNKILSSMIASFGLTFGELIFLQKDDY
jgi:hypothetical protein